MVVEMIGAEKIDEVEAFNQAAEKHMENAGG